MPELHADRLRRLLVESPAHVGGYNGLVMALQSRDLVGATRAAAHACAIDPGNHRLRKNLLLLLRTSNRWDEIDVQIPRRRCAMPTRANHPVDLEGAVARYPWLLDQLKMRSWEGWTPSRVEDSKYRFPLTREHLAAFRRSEVSSGTQTVPDRPENFPPLLFDRLYPPLTPTECAEYGPKVRRQFLGLLSRLYRHTSPGIDWYDAAAVDDDRFGARVLELPGLGTVSSKSLQSAY